VGHPDLNILREKEKAIMMEYKKLDGDKIRIPIARAMELIVSESKGNAPEEPAAIEASALPTVHAKPASISPTHKPEEKGAVKAPDAHEPEAKDTVKAHAEPPQEKPKRDTTPAAPKTEDKKGTD